MYVRSRILLLQGLDHDSPFFYLLGDINTYYMVLFSLDPSSEDDRRDLWEDLLQISLGHTRMLDGPVTFEELTNALTRFSSGNSLGLNGLTKEFFRAFWAILMDDTPGGVFCGQTAGPFLAQVIIILLPKKGDLQSLKNWRPVSLLSTDYKIFGRMLPAFYQDLIAAWDVFDSCWTYLPSGMTAIVREPLLRNLHLHNRGFEWLAEGGLWMTCVEDMLGGGGLGW
eukprot:g30741.t1